MSEIDNLKKLINQNNRRLQKLKEQQAVAGLQTDPRIVIEIEDIEAEIESLQNKLSLLKQQDLSNPAVEAEIVTGFNWSEIRQVVRLASEYIAQEQKQERMWLRSDLFPTSRTLFSLLTSGCNISDAVFERSINWLRNHLTDSHEKPDAVAMAILTLEAAKRVGMETPLDKGIEIILRQQNPDGSWPGRYNLDRYFAASTAYCVQALRAYMVTAGSDSVCQTACHKGVQYLERYFRSLDLANIQYSEIVNPLEPLMLPYYEAWRIVNIGPIARAVDFFVSKRDEYKRFGNIKAVAGILNLLSTQWHNFDEDTMGELLAWLLQNRNSDYGWSEHIGEPSEPHQTAMIALPIRQFERLGDHYVPLEISDDWSLPIDNNVVKEHSVGAVVFRRLLDTPEIILLRRSNGTWVLPKGHIEAGEEIETALRREITEETGITQVVIIEDLAEYRYLFRPDGDVVDKRVTYFLAESSSLDIHLAPDDDHSEVKWFSIDDVPLLPLYYDDARQAIQKAKLRLKNSF